MVKKRPSVPDVGARRSERSVGGERGGGETLHAHVIVYVCVPVCELPPEAVSFAVAAAAATAAKLEWQSIDLAKLVGQGD
ncbi:hypothetical protein GWI33_007051 [Rhynchophorus ferrugineus]|uniref:Uncharacterized protein n=1 Tax=Rhynchophorus ferrugineus TaxID=354439 RepID=A0A834II82_RHYFE|nr:hypothetical protein GWI33_007051 [Rhynchophorus ferrugineus]